MAFDICNIGIQQYGCQKLHEDLRNIDQYHLTTCDTGVEMLYFNFFHSCTECSGQYAKIFVYLCVCEFTLIFPLIGQKGDILANSLTLRANSHARMSSYQRDILTGAFALNVNAPERMSSISFHIQSGFVTLHNFSFV